MSKPISVSVSDDYIEKLKTLEISPTEIFRRGMACTLYEKGRHINISKDFKEQFDYVLDQTKEKEFSDLIIELREFFDLIAKKTEETQLILNMFNNKEKCDNNDTTI